MEVLDPKITHDDTPLFTNDSIEKLTLRQRPEDTKSFVKARYTLEFPGFVLVYVMRVNLQLPLYRWLIRWPTLIILTSMIPLLSMIHLYPRRGSGSREPDLNLENCKFVVKNEQDLDHMLIDKDQGLDQLFDDNHHRFIVPDQNFESYIDDCRPVKNQGVDQLIRKDQGLDSGHHRFSEKDFGRYVNIYNLSLIKHKIKKKQFDLNRLTLYFYFISP
ncbi:uncharacterized protein LOC123263072 [Cotesia glomerata]|uniref:uncharacterized protein LOC123263072 n=1 Tax=Cotesia glomerata TaxID=32391 RepID=UPI001D00C265|nr:uncharacterized protein LOC123263072 [Cotesia glomerata]